MLSSTTTSEPGHQRDPTPEREHAREARQTDREGQPVGVAEVGDEVAELAKEVALAFGDTEQLGQLADDDGQRQADDEALQHRLGDERREEPQPSQAGAPARGRRSRPPTPP